jgi:hypothetical protein
LKKLILPIFLADLLDWLENTSKHKLVYLDYLDQKETALLAYPTVLYSMLKEKNVLPLLS